MRRSDLVWTSAQVARRFLAGVRGAIPLAAEQIDIMLRISHSALPDARTFLDIGCGDGVLSQALRSIYPGATGVLLDFSDSMLDAARRRFEGENGLVYFLSDYGRPDWVEAVQPLAPFDVVVSGFSIHHQPDARKFALYAEIYDLLAPGGLFLNLEHVASPSEWLESLFDDLMIDSMHAYDQHNGGGQSRQQVAEQHHTRPDKVANILSPVEAQCDWLREIGYAHVDCYFKLFELALFGGLRPV